MTVVAATGCMVGEPGSEPVSEEPVPDEALEQEPVEEQPQETTMTSPQKRKWS